MSESENEEPEEVEVKAESKKNKKTDVSAALAAASSQFTKQLQEMLEKEEYQGVLKYCGAKLAKNTKQPFFVTLKAFCLMKLGKFVECKDVLAEIKPFKQTEPHTVKFLCMIFTTFGENKNATRLLEAVKDMHNGREDIATMQFFAYIRETNILGAQQQALVMYHTHNKDLFALWTIECMYLHSKRHKFETKILDLSYLLMLKLMKEDNFKMDRKFIDLYTCILSRQNKFQESLDFIDSNNKFFADERITRLRKEAQMYNAMGNPALTISVYFNLLRSNNTPHSYKEMWNEYLTVVRIVLDDYGVREKFDFAKEHIQSMHEENPGDGVSTTNAEWGAMIQVGDPPIQLINTLYQSIRQLRRGARTIDQTSKSMKAICDAMVRTSYRTEMEFMYIYSLHCPDNKFGVGTPFWQILCEYIDGFYSQADIVGDVNYYLQLLAPTTDGVAIHARLADRVRKEEEYAKKTAEEERAAEAANPAAKKGKTFKVAKQPMVSLKVLQWRFILYKMAHRIGLYSREHMPDNDERMKLINEIFRTFLQAMEWVTAKSDKWSKESDQTISTLDINNSEDILIIALELLSDVKIWEKTVFSPVNFQMIVMAEYGLNYYPNSTRLFAWLTKLYAKLGLVKIVNDLSERFPTAPQAIFEGLSLSEPADSKAQGAAKTEAKKDTAKEKKEADPKLKEGHFVDQDVEAMGATRLSLYTAFGFEEDLYELVRNYEDHYRDQISQKQNALCTLFQDRDMAKVLPSIEACEAFAASPFRGQISFVRTLGDIVKWLDKGPQGVKAIHLLFNGEFSHIDEVICSCEQDEGFILPRDPYDERRQEIPRKRFKAKDVGPLEYAGCERPVVRKYECIAHPYDDKAAQLRKALLSEKEYHSDKFLGSLYGYKHTKTLKTYGTLLQCLRDCYDQSYEQLNATLHEFLMLKNELSLHFLQKPENMAATLRTAVHLYAKEHKGWSKVEEAELKWIDKMTAMASQSEAQATRRRPKEEHKMPSLLDLGQPGTQAKAGEGPPRPEITTEQYKKYAFEKLTQRLLLYNQKMNGGKRISVLDYLAQVDPLSGFMKEYGTQRHLRRAFLEEFKIGSLNYVTLLFESCERILTTLNRSDMEDTHWEQQAEARRQAREEAGEEEGSDASDDDGDPKVHYFSKNAKRFMSQKQKRTDAFVTPTVGWTHVARLVEVLGMQMRDLIYKIVPTKITVHELKTSQGKVLGPESAYALDEIRTTVPDGRKTKVEYVYELDLVEDAITADEATKEKKRREARRKANVLTLNLDDFNLFKLRASVYLLQWPVTFTLLIINVWQKIMPEAPREMGFPREECYLIEDTERAMKVMTKDTVTHLGSLSEYLTEVKKSRPMNQNYQQIKSHQYFTKFKEVFTKSQGVNVMRNRLDEMITSTYNRMEDAFNDCMDNALSQIEAKQKMMDKTYSAARYRDLDLDQ